MNNVVNLLRCWRVVFILNKINVKLAVDGSPAKESQGFDGLLERWVMKDGEHGELWQAEGHGGRFRMYRNRRVVLWMVPSVIRLGMKSCARNEMNVRMGRVSVVNRHFLFCSAE